MSFHIVENTDGSTTFQEDAGGDSSGEVRVVFADGSEIGFGESQGAAAASRHTYVKLTRADGTDVYLSVDAGTTLDVSATRPASI